MEQDLEQSPFHHQPTACSEPHSPQRDDAFKDLLLHISQDMSSDDAAALAFTATNGTTSGGSPSALEVLRLLVRRGEFSARSCGKLDGDLRRINRCDLAEHVREYMEKYPEIQRPNLELENGAHPHQHQPVGIGLPVHQEQSVDIGSELHIVASGGPVHSTPKRQQNTASPDLGHELFDALALNPHQNMLVPSSTSLCSSFPSGSSPVEIASHHERGSSLEQSTSAHTGEYQSSFNGSQQNSSSNLQWGGQEGYDHPSQSANLSRDSSNYSLSSSISQLSKASLQKAEQLLYRAMDVVAHQSQDQLHWYHSASTSTASIPRLPQSDTSSMYSDVGAGNKDPWAKKQSHSFHGRVTTNTHQVRMRRTPSVPVRNRDFISRHRQVAGSVRNHARCEFATPFGVETRTEPIIDSFSAYAELKQPANQSTIEHAADTHSDGTPGQSVTADSRRQSTISDATIKRVSVASETPSETTITSPRTSVYGKEAVPADVAEEVGESRKPSSPPAAKEKPRLRTKLSFLRSKSRTSSSSPCFMWKVVREDLIKPIWRHQAQASLTRPGKLELDANNGKHNPKLTFQLFPYGLHRDEGEAVTMAVRIATPDKCPPLPLSSEIQLRLAVFDVEGKEVKRCPCVTEKLSKISIFYVYTVVTHNQLKESKSKYFNLEIDIASSGLT